MLYLLSGTNFWKYRGPFFLDSVTDEGWKGRIPLPQQDVALGVLICQSVSTVCRCWYG